MYEAPGCFSWTPPAVTASHFCYTIDLLHARRCLAGSHSHACCAGSVRRQKPPWPLQMARVAWPPSSKTGQEHGPFPAPPRQCPISLLSTRCTSILGLHTTSPAVSMSFIYPGPMPVRKPSSDLCLASPCISRYRCRCQACSRINLLLRGSIPVPSLLSLSLLSRLLPALYPVPPLPPLTAASMYPMGVCICVLDTRSAEHLRRLLSDL